MSRTRGKREAAGGRRDPFEETERNHSGGGWSGGKKALAAVLCLLAVLVLAGAGWWFLFVRAPDVKDNDRPLVNNNNPNRKPGEDEDDEQVLTGRKEDYFTFLLIGRDTAGGGNTDTLILVSYDVPNSQVNMMSIPRDTVVNVPWSVKKINSVFNAKESSGGGMEGLKKQVAYLTGVMPDFHVIIEWKAVGEIVKAVGGVDFDVPRNMNYDDDYQNLHIHLNKGMQHLNAEQAMAMLRYRNDNGYKAGYNDIGRMNTQRDFLKAMAKEVLQLKNMTKIGEFINIFMDNVETDLKVSELTWFASKALSVDLETMQSSTLPYIDVGKYRGGDYLFPNGEEIVPLVNEQFNPYNQEITADSLQIMVRSKDGSCYVTNGELLDAKWAKPASGSAGTTGGGVTTTEPTGVVADPNVPPPSTPSGDDSKPADPAQPPDENAGQEGTPPPEAADPDTTPPGTADPGTTPPATTDPGAAPPEVTDPGTTPPATTDPGAAPPEAADPGATPPAATDPGAAPPEATDPGAAPPAATDPAAPPPPLELPPPEDPVPPPDEGSPAV